MQVGLKLFFLVSNNKPGWEYVCCFTDETLTRAGDVVPEEFWKRAGVRVRRVPGTRGRVGSAQDGKCRMPLFFTKTQYYLSSDRGAGMERGEPGSVGLPPQRWVSPGNSRPVGVRDHLGSLGVLPRQPLFFFNKYNQVNIIMERSLKEASFSFG